MSVLAEEGGVASVHVTFSFYSSVLLENGGVVFVSVPKAAIERGVASMPHKPSRARRRGLN